MKKYIALLLTLIITASTLAACADSVPGSSSSYVPVSSSVVSLPSSSVAVSSLPQSSSSIVSSLPVSSLPVPEWGSIFLSETETHLTYLITDDFITGYITYELTVPKPLFIDGMQIELNSEQKLADIRSVDLTYEEKTIEDLIAPSPLDLSYENGVAILQNTNKIYYSVSSNNYNGYSYSFNYILPIDENMVIAVIFYIFFPPENYDPANDHVMFLEIMNSIEVIEIV